MPKDNRDELFYLVDDNDEVLGSVTRGQAHSSNSIRHRSIFILLFNDQNELLLQKRSLDKDTFPGFWTVSVSGHVAYGQSYDEAAQREMAEEIGLDLPLDFVDKIYLPAEREFASIYRATLSSEVKINFDQDEISQVKWIAKKQLVEFLTENEVTPAARQVLEKFIV